MAVLACAELPPSVAKHPPDYTLSTTTWLYDNDDRTTDQSQFCRQYQHVQILDPYSEIGAMHMLRQMLREKRCDPSCSIGLGAIPRLDNRAH